MTETYQHFKGGIYRLLFRGRDATRPAAAEVIVYISLDDGSVWTRTREDFEMIVTWPDGKKARRFEPYVVRERRHGG